LKHPLSTGLVACSETFFYKPAYEKRFAQEDFEQFNMFYSQKCMIDIFVLDYNCIIFPIFVNTQIKISVLLPHFGRSVQPTPVK
jgi:hypothetical protein